ncbi:cytochrome c oxidase assembly factor Coa1 family protein [Myxococcus qinghaiensis]|uniref:cytochrome c oxidase assembly factor Coa1 family protein n=1 Tax=Myxococcus qinghaiensis TaxID=2906758 RepID=UPI0020A77F13|nr:cytochrome c oxidase assembly factor Coa1 family protein [Myxococcus qinghaiensis]MCP3164642.1 cytochrome c oxidase assembly factor 1 family protein [Myxococcus qinghaiensis]
MDASPEGSLVPQQGWWSRNWKWFVPVGCLGVLASCGCLGFALVGFGYSSLKNMDAFTEAVAIARSDAEVRSALGTPIDNGLPKQTSVQTVNGVTHARLAIPLDGPQADGLLHVDATKQGEGEWEYDTLAVELEDGSRIDLRDDAPRERPNAFPEDEGADEAPLPPPTEPPGREEDAPARGRDSDIEL